MSRDAATRPARYNATNSSSVHVHDGNVGPERRRRAVLRTSADVMAPGVRATKRARLMAEASPARGRRRKPLPRGPWLFYGIAVVFRWLRDRRRTDTAI